MAIVLSLYSCTVAENVIFVFGEKPVEILFILLEHGLHFTSLYSCLCLLIFSLGHEIRNFSKRYSEASLGWVFQLSFSKWALWSTSKRCLTCSDLCCMTHLRTHLIESFPWLWVSRITVSEIPSPMPPVHLEQGELSLFPFRLCQLSREPAHCADDWLKPWANVLWLEMTAGDGV